jgi:hypothetical protein
MVEDLAGDMASVADLIVPDEYPAVRLVLSGDEQAQKWGVSDNAVGYFSVMSQIQYDTAEDEENWENGWQDVNEDLEVHLNMDYALRMLDGVSRDDMQIELESWLVTVPHEFLHVKDWMLATNGQTPIQVFDAGRGELEIMRVKEEIDRKYIDAGLDQEDEIEMTGIDITRHVTAHGNRLSGYVDEIATLIQPSPAQVCH